MYKVKYQFDSEADDRHTNFAGFFERQMLRIAKCPTVSFEIYRLLGDHDQFSSILPTSEDIAVLQLLTSDTIEAVMKSLAKGRKHFFKVNQSTIIRTRSIVVGNKVSSRSTTG